LRRHKPLAFEQGDRRERDGLAQPGERTIAEIELQIALDGHDRTTGTQVLHGHLTGHERQGRGAAQTGARFTSMHDRVP
jgi:hypothetical protein